MAVEQPFLAVRLRSENRLKVRSTDKQKAVHNFCVRLFSVGVTGFEPMASSTRTKRATGLRYIP